MARPRTIDDDTILAAAREVFMRDGGQATTAEVARAAGISEGTIFKRFATKDELFASAFECHSAWLADLPARAGQGDLRAHLATVIAELLAMFRVVLPRVMMRAAHGGMTAAALFRDMPEPPPVRVLRLLGDWLAAEMKLGRLRSTDAQVAARALIGAAHNVAFLELVAPEAARTDDDAFAAALADLLVGGLRPEQDAGAPARGRR